MNYILTALIGVIATLGVFNPKPDFVLWDEYQSFGATSYPTALDSLTNPSATDSVATVSHSSQHANANDAIEALQAKLGIGASTATANTVLAGTGTGVTAFTASPTLTTLTTTNLVATNATSTNATSTLLYVSGTASTTQLNANTLNVGSTTTNVANVAMLNVGSCVGCVAASLTMYVATSTTNRYMAKTLDLVAGDIVTWQGSMDEGNNCGDLIYRISSPWQVASTTVIADATCADDPHSFHYSFMATTTSTVTFSYQAGVAVSSAMYLLHQPASYNNAF